MKCRNVLAVCGAAVLFIAAPNALANHYYGVSPGDNDPPIDVISGTLFGNGTASGLLPVSAPQPNEGFAHIVFYANAGDSITVDTNGSNADSGLAVLYDAGLDGIFVGDAPLNSGSELSFAFADDDSGVGLNSLINFNAPYTGAYLASVSEIGGGEMNWTVNVSGSTWVPEPASASLLAFVGLATLTRRRR